MGRSGRTLPDAALGALAECVEHALEPLCAAHPRMPYVWTSAGIGLSRLRSSGGAVRRESRESIEKMDPAPVEDGGLGRTAPTAVRPGEESGEALVVGFDALAEGATLVRIRVDAPLTGLGTGARRGVPGGPLRVGNVRGRGCLADAVGGVPCSCYLELGFAHGFSIRPCAVSMGRLCPRGHACTPGNRL